MKKKEVGFIAVMAALAAVLLLIGAEQLLIHGPLGPYMRQTEFSHMMVELLLFLYSHGFISPSPLLWYPGSIWSI